MNETIITPTITTSEQFIETGLKKFEESEITKEGLIALADSVKDLVIKDANDKAGARAVEEGRKLLKKKRNAIKKTADDIRETAKRFNQAVIAREKELTVLIEPTELMLEKRESDWYAERERIRQEEERKESERIQNMLDQLNELNYAVDFHQLKAFTDEQFQAVLAEAKTKYEETARLMEIERQKEEERVRLEAEEKRKEEERQAQLRKEEELRLETIRKEQEEIRLENERKQKEFEEQQRKFREEQEQIRIENERKEKELADRQRQLDEEENQRLDKIRQSRQAILSDFDYHPNRDLATLSEDDFDKLRNEAEITFNEKQARLKQQQKEKEEAYEKERMRCAEDSQRFYSMHTQLVRMQSTFKDYADLNTSLAGVEAASIILKKISECIEIAKQHKNINKGVAHQK